MEQILDLCDPQLIFKKADRQNYTCAGCHSIAYDAKVLVCDATYHEEDPTLYCGRCANTMTENNQCVFNNHPDPLFIDAKMVQRRVRQMKVLCVHSKLYQSRLKSHEPGEHVPANDVYDTIDGEVKYNDERPLVLQPHNEDVAIDCKWRGKYMALQNHINNECLYKPIPCPFDECRSNKKDRICKVTRTAHLQRNVPYHLDLLNQRTKVMHACVDQLMQNVDELKLSVANHEAKWDEAMDSRRREPRRDCFWWLVFFLSSIVGCVSYIIVLGS
eukprot:691535_1